MIVVKQDEVLTFNKKDFAWKESNRLLLLFKLYSFKPEVFAYLPTQRVRKAILLFTLLIELKIET